MACFRMKLFDDAEDSPVPVLRPILEESPLLLVTPTSKGGNPFTIHDEDSGIGMDTDSTDVTDFVTPVSLEADPVLEDSFSEFQIRRRVRSVEIKRSLFCRKRPASCDPDVQDISPAFKKLRDTENQLSELSLTASPRLPDTGKIRIIQAVDRLSADDNLVADGTRAHCLPTVPSKHGDLRCISADTMSELISGRYDNGLGRVTVIDCRYPYEYDGGHIKGAVNLYTRQSIQQFLHENMGSSEQHVVIFHCEFSSERGPKMYRFLRSLDRELNRDHYPRLHFPEIYLLEGGYKAFFQTHQDCCFPVSYKPMLHEDHGDDLRHFRVKSKSWAAGEKGRGRQKHRSRIGISF